MDNVTSGIFDSFQEVDPQGTEVVFGDNEGLEVKMPDPEIRNDMEGFVGKDVVVFGNPLDTGEKLDYQQGDNPYFAEGNCGLVSIANFLNLGGMEEANEDMITKYALDNDKCEDGWFIPPSDRGGTTIEDIQSIMQDFGVETQAFAPYETGGSIEEIANQIESGHIATLGLNAGYLWNDPAYVGDGSANHEVTLTGTVRDAETGELLGLTICDSGDGKACDVLSVDELQLCYEDAPAAHVIISNDPIRAI